jgi:hypothetical protein
MRTPGERLPSPVPDQCEGGPGHLRRGGLADRVRRRVWRRLDIPQVAASAGLVVMSVYMRNLLIRLRFMPVIRRLAPLFPWFLYSEGADVPPPDLTPKVKGPRRSE